ncbi:MAG: type II secretion system protein GspE, partial [Deltaproteobacteria bacterium]
MSRLGELLVRRGQLEPAALTKAVEEQRAHGGALASHLVKLGFINEDALLSYLQKEYRLPVVDPSNLDIPTEVLALVPPAMVQKHHVIPVNLVRSTSNLIAINEVKFLTGYDVKIAVAGASAVQRAIERYYETNVNYDQMLNELGGGDVQLVHGEEEINLQDLERATEEAPVVRLVNALLTDAIAKRASDVHVEPYEKMLRIRFRIDGVLYEVMQPPVKLKNALTSRIKVMASLDIAERRMPQDGRIKLKL